MKSPINRRSFLKLASIAGMSLSYGTAFANKLSKNQKMKQTGRIDVHHHILPPVYKSALVRIGINSAGGARFPNWNAQKSLNIMDRNGISSAITSISSPGIYFGDIDFSIDLAKRCNEFSANLIRDNEMRFGGFAVLPLPDVDAALKELEYAHDILKLDGVVLLSNVDGHYLGTPKFYELYSELNRRKAIVYIHPTVPPKGKFPEMKIPPSAIEFVFDTTRAISNLILNKTLRRFPDIRFIVSHAGGTAPYIAWRMFWTDFRFRTDSIGALKSMYYDTALSASPYALRSLQELVDYSRIVFGSDYPFAPGIITTASINQLDNYDGFDKKQLNAVYRDNALNLFPRFKGN